MIIRNNLIRRAILLSVFLFVTGCGDSGVQSGAKLPGTQESSPGNNKEQAALIEKNTLYLQTLSESKFAFADSASKSGAVSSAIIRAFGVTVESRNLSNAKSTLEGFKIKIENAVNEKVSSSDSNNTIAAKNQALQDLVLEGKRVATNSRQTISDVNSALYRVAGRTVETEMLSTAIATLSSVRLKFETVLTQDP